MRNNDRILLILILLGLLIRLILLPLPGFKIDVDTWFAWSQRLSEIGFSNFYSDQVWTNYTPGFLYILKLLGSIKASLQIPDTLFYLILKIPSIIAEIILGILAYQQVIKKSLFWARITAAAILLNPAFIFNSSIWGQIDGLLSLTLLSILIYLNQKQLILSSIFFGISLLIKPQSIMIIPVFIFFIFRNFSINNLLRLTAPALITSLFLSLPFFINQPVSGLPNLITKMVGDYPYLSVFAFNLWGVIGFWINDNSNFINLSLQNWGYLLILIYFLILFFFNTKKGIPLFILTALFTLSFYFLPTRVHDRYLYPALVFLFITAGLLRSKRILILTLLLSSIHFLNLYYVYVYYNESYLKLPHLLFQIQLYSFVELNTKLLSLTSTLLFVLATIDIIKSYEFSKKN